MPISTVVHALVEATQGSGTLTVLRDAGAPGEVTWAQLHRRARRMVSVLGRHGVSRGSRVGIVADTSLATVAALQAVWLTGAAVTLLAPPRRGSASGLGPVVQNAGLQLLIADDPSLPGAISLSDMDSEASIAPMGDVVMPEPKDLAILQYTSGSTGSPRGVPVTHAHLAANLDAITAAFQGSAGHEVRMASWLPLYHDMGLIGFLALPMANGWRLVMQPPVMFALRPASWLQTISRYAITVTAAPNFAFRLMTPLLEAGLDADLSTLKVLLSGGEPIDPLTVRQFLSAAGEYGLNPAAFVPAYGLAEATLAVAISTPDAGLQLDTVDRHRLEHEGVAFPSASQGSAFVRVGPPVPGTRIRIADEGGNVAGERRVGQVQVQGPAVVGHYWGEPPPPEGSWLDTGDLGYLADGELIVCGRRKDVLFAAGRNIYPQDVEAAAASVGLARGGRVAAFGVPGPAGDRLVVAVESRGSDVRVLRQAVMAAVTAEVGMTPADVVILAPGRLPKTTSGKLRRAEARLRYLHGELVPQKERTVQ